MLNLFYGNNKTAILLSLVLGLSCSQLPREKKQNQDSVKMEYVIQDSAALFSKSTTALDLFLKVRADSINRLRAGRLPEFLDEVQFDYNYSGMSMNSNLALPLRKMIFDRVTNCKSLLLIVGDTSSSYRKHPVKQYHLKVDSGQYSYFELAKMRLDDLKCVFNAK